ncbi:PrsW family intramembrane metalloprotease [Mycobacterium sp. 852014-52144_SCH5372336]|uniref:PrsW family intramembrane metalloprotease n=1 Tax=Mycobacterium sp. 852014-52144_SCH5372336 TaxID=1834115 RepID=UPI00080247C2|nr:PrsW family intramembrane metalloprotease [Mycobacterium sp. 852014-52144_SCH5372336]OBB77451.1 hypothetical protein A5759_04230 [Mycobacterium sp. 852014-52144_SCH5372336]
MTGDTVQAPRPVVYRPESAVFWVFVVALIVGTLLLLDDSWSVIRATLDAHLDLAWLWLLFIVFMVWLIFRFDPFRSGRRYPQALVAGFALGGTTAVAMAMIGNDALGQLWSLVLPPETVTDWQASLTAPIIEEASKALCAAVVLVLCGHVLQRISHALMLGMFVGFGFDLMEDLSYAANSALQDLDSDVVGAGGNLLVRFFTAVPAHWTYTALTSVGVLMLLPTFRGGSHWSTGRRLATACGLLLSGPLLHFIWNAPGPVAAMPLKILGGLVFFLIVAALLLRDERRWVIARIAAGRASGELSGIRDDVLDSLPTRRRRRALKKAAKKAGGRAAAKAVKAQQRAALDRIQGSWTAESAFAEPVVQRG